MGEERKDRWPVLQLIPAAWLLLVLLAYTLVVFAPTTDPTGPVPGMADADRVAGPMLIALLLAGIIRHFTLRQILGFIPLVWLLQVLLAYVCVAFAPVDRPTAPVLGLAEANLTAGPLLAALLLAGIIRYFSLWHASRPSASKTPSRQG